MDQGEKMKAGIVICARVGSSRLPGKAIMKLNGEPLIRHLVRRVLPTGLPIVIAVPNNPEMLQFKEALGDLASKVHFFEAHPSNPLARMADAANWLELKAVIRICTDKIFVEPTEILRFIEIFKNSQLDYLYSSSFVPGSGFELIRASTLQDAAEYFYDVEHVSFAIRATTDKVTDVPVEGWNGVDRLLIDHSADIDVIENVLRFCGNGATLRDAVKYLFEHPRIAVRNKTPQVTVYTCAYNAEKFLEEAAASVLGQVGIDFEYLIIDDFSKDRTAPICDKLAFANRRVRVRRNGENLGLASSSNRAVGLARGEFIVRLDADDHFTSLSALKTLYGSIKSTEYDVVYPSHYIGTPHKIGRGREYHHAGGAIFRTKALQFLGFTDGLRHHDSYDLWKRAVSRLKIGYLNVPVFMYRQTEGSLSRSEPEVRDSVKREIDARIP
jgi:spore coat polysaccharide biosynthesis protein SpsF (cytidylyltransferase family)